MVCRCYLFFFSHYRCFWLLEQLIYMTEQIRKFSFFFVLDGATRNYFLWIAVGHTSFVVHAAKCIVIPVFTWWRFVLKCFGCLTRISAFFTKTILSD